MIQHVINKTMGYSITQHYIDLSSDISAVTDIINATGQELAKEKAWQKKIIDPPKLLVMIYWTRNRTDYAEKSPSDQWPVTSKCDITTNFDRRVFHDSNNSNSITRR